MDVKLRIPRAWFHRQLFPSDKWYSLPRTQEKGEADLRKLAATATREYLWTYFTDSDIWVHVPGAHFETTEPNGNTNMEMHIPDIESSFPGKTPVTYHIHPSKARRPAIEAAVAKGKLGKNLLFTLLEADIIPPSDSDLLSLLGRNRNLQHKIVTEFGTTTFVAGPSKIFPNELAHGRYSDRLNRELQRRYDKAEGTTDLAMLSIATLNDLLHGYAKVEYKRSETMNVN